jgi:O-antigen ligase
VERLFGSAAPLFVAMLVITTALLLTESRAGVLSALLGLLVLALTALRGRTIAARQAVALSLLLLLAGVAVFSMSGDNLAERLAQSEVRKATDRGRGPVYAIVVRALGDAPLLGTGYGSFRDVFPLYRDASFEDLRVWDKAHSTYLENALELGIPAAAALCGAVLSCARCCWLGIRQRRRNRIYPAIGVATTALVAVHSAVDFSLQIPAVSVTYAFILGIACAQSFSTRDLRGNRSSLAPRLAPQSTLKPSALLG